ncbi:MAG: flagellar biosynthesis regulator FlaF [Pseudomonadota bacterium]
MTAPQMAQSAYAATATSVRTPRGTEYDAIAKITGRLKASTTSAAKSFAGLVRALHDNRRLWALLAADVSDDNNQLPQNVRAQIFYLAEFVAQHTSKVLQKKGDVEVLIDINSAILRGLKPKGI